MVGFSPLQAGLVLDKESFVWLLPGYVAIGVGVGLSMTPANTDLMNAAPAPLRGEAAGTNQALRQVGGTLGLAVMSAAVAGAQGSGAGGTMSRSAVEALTSGVQTSYWVAALVMLATCVVAAMLLGRAPRIHLPMP